MSWWMVSAAANGVILVAYLVIASSIAYGLTKTHQWRSNLLASATAAIFFTCAIHHGGHLAEMLLPYAGLERQSGLAMRAALAGWHASTWDLVAAGVAVWFLTFRGRLSALFEDLRQRERQALEINDEIVQGIAVARYAFAAGDEARGREALDATLASSRRLLTDLLAGAGPETRLRGGELIRERPASLTAG
jgi:hypothetical protein